MSLPLSRAFTPLTTLHISLLQWEHSCFPDHSHCCCFLPLLLLPLFLTAPVPPQPRAAEFALLHVSPWPSPEFGLDI